MPPIQNQAPQPNQFPVFNSPTHFEPPLPPVRSKRSRYIVAAASALAFILVVSAVTFGLYGNNSAKKISVSKSKTVSTLKATPSTSTSKPTSTTSTTTTTNTTSHPVTKSTATTSSTQQATTLPVSNYQGTLPSSVPINASSGSDYYYAGDRQYANASGASVTLGQYKPSVAQTTGSENHSLMEMSAESTNGQQIVEVGWIVDPALNGDNNPHLFVFYWVNGVPASCYNTCGFVGSGSSIGPGSTVSAGSSANYSINYSGGNWNISYNGTEIGYFPESLWGGNYTEMNFVNVFGEVELTNGTTTKCVQMGNGIAGTSPGAATISNFSLINSSSSPALSPFATESSSYSYGNASATGVDIGGPGVC